MPNKKVILRETKTLSYQGGILEAYLHSLAE